MSRDRRTEQLQIRTNTLHGYLPPLHLPAVNNEQTEIDLTPACAVEDDTIVVDVEVNAAGQIEIISAERVQ